MLLFSGFWKILDTDIELSPPPRRVVHLQGKRVGQAMQKTRSLIIAASSSDRADVATLFNTYKTFFITDPFVFMSGGWPIARPVVLSGSVTGQWCHFHWSLVSIAVSIALLRWSQWDRLTG